MKEKSAQRLFLEHCQPFWLITHTFVTNRPAITVREHSLLISLYVLNRTSSLNRCLYSMEGESCERNHR